MKRVFAGLALSGLAGLPVAMAKAPDAAGFDMATEAAPAPTACPAHVGEGTTCLAGRDSAGAFYLIAMPKAWNGDLVLHAHGGPFLGAPTARRVVKTWSAGPSCRGWAMPGRRPAIGRAA